MSIDERRRKEAVLEMIRELDGMKNTVIWTIGEESKTMDAIDALIAMMETEGLSE